jgi:hypothetical protein
MAYRGRLLFPFVAVIRRLDTSATEAVGGAGAGYDPDFRTTKKTYPGNMGVAASTRRELTAVQVKCQVEIGRWEQQRQMASGNATDSQLTTVIHFKELETLGLVDVVTGDALFRVNDRLESILRLRDGALVQAVRTPAPGLFATEVQPAAFGLGRERNLLVITWAPRAQGLVAPPG